MDEWLQEQRRYVRRLATDLPEWYSPRDLFTVDSVTSRYDEYARKTIQKGLATLSKGGMVEKFDGHGKNLYSLRP